MEQEEEHVTTIALVQQFLQERGLIKTLATLEQEWSSFFIIPLN